MPHEIIPADQPHEEPGDSSEQRATSGTDANRKRRRRPSASAIPSRDDCLHQLRQLPGLVAMKLLSPAQANSIRATYQTMLQEIGRAAASQDGTLSNDDVLRILRENPELLSLIEPLLTQEQIDLLMREDGQDDEPNA